MLLIGHAKSDMKKHLMDAMEFIWENTMRANYHEQRKLLLFLQIKVGEELSRLRRWRPLEQEEGRDGYNFLAVQTLLDFVHDRLVKIQENTAMCLGCPSKNVGGWRRTQDQDPAETASIASWIVKLTIRSSRRPHPRGGVSGAGSEGKARALFACYQGTMAQAQNPS